ncbi:outer membrane protein [Candidatus Latescibacterota bacterium]
MHKRVWIAILSVALAAFAVVPAGADVSAFVAMVGFDDEANLNSSPGVGLRWGKSSGFIGGETSLMLTRPERDLPGQEGANATALFYEGRVVVNIPVGEITPFVDAGFGWITVTSTDVVEEGLPDNELEALQAVADLQTKSAFSYGAGVRYSLSDRMDLRVDLRQYQVFSVAGVAVQAAAAAADVEAKDNTVQYSELSAGVVIRF